MACNLLEFKIIKLRERLRNNAILKETNKTWQLNATCYSELYPFAVKNIIETSGKAWMGSEGLMVVMKNVHFLIRVTLLWFLQEYIHTKHTKVFKSGRS